MSYLTLHEDLPTQIAVSSLMVFDKVPYDVLHHNSHHACGLVALHHNNFIFGISKHLTYLCIIYTSISVII